MLRYQNRLSTIKQYVVDSAVLFIGFAIFLMSFSQKGLCQYDMPLNEERSPERTISEKIGKTKITISYGATSVDGDEIWGSTFPYGDLWSPPEADVTTIKFSKDVVIDNQLIVQGTYLLYVYPQSNNIWTVIFNEVPDDDDDDEESYEYDPANDVLTLQIPAESVDHVERINFDIDGMSSRTCDIIFTWVNDKISFNVQTFAEDFIEDQLNEALVTAQNYNRWVFYLIAAEALYISGENMNKSMTWINLSETHSSVQMEWNFTEYTQSYVMGHMYWTKAKILAASGDVNQAITYTQSAINLTDNSYYLQNNTSENIDVLLADWTGT